MRTALEMGIVRGGNLRRGLHFDIHDNLKENTVTQGYLASASAAAQGELAGLGLATGNINASDQAALVNSGNTTTTLSLIDPGAIAAGAAIADSAIKSNMAATQAAASTLRYALEKETDLAKQTQAGEVNAFVKTLGWVAVGLGALWALAKVFGGRATKGAT